LEKTMFDSDLKSYGDPKKHLQERAYNNLMENAIAKRVMDLQTGKSATVLRTGDVLETARQEFLADHLVIVPDETGQQVFEATREEEARALAASRKFLEDDGDAE
jgi:hypothetical protein